MAEDPTIIEWIDGAMQGDQDAFAELVYTYQDAVYNLSYRMLGESGEAEDAAQEAFLRAYNNLHRYDPNRSFKTWILSIASNHCIDRLRKRRLHYLSIDEPLPTSINLALTSDEPGPEEALQREEFSEQIQLLLEDLSPDDRLAVVLRYWYDYSYTEIADIMDMTESAIKSRLFRARRTLADKLMADSQAGSGLVNPLTEGNDYGE